MMDTYRRDGDARVYWLTLPAPRDPARQKVARVVNAAIAVAAQPYRSQVRVIDLTRRLHARRALPRRDDGRRPRDARARARRRCTSTTAGAGVALDIVLERLRADFASLG